MAAFQSRFRRFAVVVGAAALAAGVITIGTPASAQWHRNDVGAGLAAGAATYIAAGAVASAASAYDPGDGSCSWQRQRIWDGYGWQVQRIQVCD